MIFVVVSTGHFDPLIEKCNELSSQYSFFGQVGSSQIQPLFPSVKTLPPGELVEQMKKAELVISHAGTGMLSMLYDLKKPSVVIPKQIRYGEANDGQVELAFKWAELKMSVLCMDVNDLKEKIETAKKHLFQFPTFPSLGIYLAKELAGGSSVDYVLGHGQEPTPL